MTQTGYRLLYDYFRTLPLDEIRISFADIEDIIDMVLPAGAPCDPEARIGARTRTFCDENDLPANHKFVRAFEAGLRESFGRQVT